MSLWYRKRDSGVEDATAARVQAEHDLAETKAQTPWYQALAERHREIQRVNHLGLNAVKAIRGNK